MAIAPGSPKTPAAGINVAHGLLKVRLAKTAPKKWVRHPDSKTLFQALQSSLSLFEKNLPLPTHSQDS